MIPIEFPQATKEIMAQKLQAYFEQELDQHLGQFEAGFLLDFITEQFGCLYYNKGVQDSQSLLRMKAEDLVNTLEDLEYPEPR